MDLGGEAAGEDAAEGAASCKKAGRRMLKARSVVNCSSRSCNATPTRMVTVPVMARMGNDSARMRLRFSTPNLRPKYAAATAARTSTAPRTEEKTGCL